MLTENIGGVPSVVRSSRPGISGTRAASSIWKTLFAKSEDHVRELYGDFVAIIEGCGGAKIIPQKSRIAFQVRMRFAALTPQRRALKGHLVLSEKHEDPCFLRVDSYSVGNHVHVFRLESQGDLNKRFTRWVREAFRVGKQEHLK